MTNCQDVLDEFHSNNSIEEYWDLIVKIKNAFGGIGSSKQSKYAWKKQLKKRIDEKDFNHQDIRFYAEVLSSTRGMIKHRIYFNIRHDNIYEEIVRWFNEGIFKSQYQEFTTFENSLIQFNRVWRMDWATVKNKVIKVYVKRTQSMLDKNIVNNTLVQLLIYMIISSKSVSVRV
tara:strand:- start:6383 stop:6904 length:522 start_codon:yes stop_codon:yes gene_type:complete